MPHMSTSFKAFIIAVDDRAADLIVTQIPVVCLFLSLVLVFFCSQVIFTVEVILIRQVVRCRDSKPQRSLAVTSILTVVACLALPYVRIRVCPLFSGAHDLAPS